MSKDNLLRNYVASQVEVQIKFRNDPGPPVGPGKLEIVTVPINTDNRIMNTSEYFKIVAPALVAAGNGKPQQILLPVVFDADDVLWLTEGPITVEGEPAIVTPGGKRTPGGLHIGG